MPAIPKGPFGVAVLLYRGWRKLPPRQRRQALDLARRHGPTVAAKAVVATRIAAKAARKRP